jgi:hypothetical protein
VNAKLNYVPWMSLLGALGLAAGYLLGGGSEGAGSNFYALYGLGAGSILGIVVRIVVRAKTAPEPPPPGAARPPEGQEAPK